MGNEPGRHAMPTTASIQSMDESLQKKFSKGIQYNMKIVVRGDRNTGKTCLFYRMEGKNFSEAYIPTSEIQITSILWSYKVTNDTVKVEVWDVVDKGKVQRKDSKGVLKLFNNPAETQEASDIPLDADFLDVYKGAHGVVFIFDITKQWTWKYIERELPRVPLHIPIMVLGSFSDMREHRILSMEECRSFVEHLDRPEGAAEVRYAEASMKDGFGLMHLHKFLSIPFLQLQQETLLHQLKVNREQMLAASEELNAAVQTEDQNYDLFLEKLQKISEEKKRKAREQAAAAEAAGDESPKSPLKANAPDGSSSPRSPRYTAESPRTERSESFTSRLTSRFVGFRSKHKEESKKEQPSPTVSKRPRHPVSSANVDDFVPEGDVDTNFFGEEGSGDEEEEEEEEEEDESEEDVKNPQVAMDEDFSSEEEPAPPTSVAIETPPVKPKSPPVKPKSPPVKLKSAKEVVLTESEEEDEELPSQPQRKATPKSELFTTSTPAAQKPSKGLLLDFDYLSSVGDTKGKPKDPGAKKESPTTPTSATKKDSPTTPTGERRREKKRKGSKKSRHKEEEKAGGDKPPPAPVSEDPFALPPSLDAWLNAGSEESTSLGTVMQPTQVGSSTDKGTEVGVEEREGEEASHHHKKHKHRKHRDREEGGTTHRKKHKHKSRHSQKPTDGEQSQGNYNLI